jgi:hypothetical protein
MTNVDASYMSQFLLFDAPTDVELMRSLVADSLQLTGVELDAIENKFKAATSLADLYLVEVVRADPVVQLPVAVGGHIVRPTKQRKLIPQIVDENLKLKVVKNQHIVKPNVCKFGAKCHSKRCRYAHPLK